MKRELEPALLSRLDGGIGAGLTQLEVARICSREGYLADLQRGFAVIPQAYNERFAIISRCNAAEIVARGSDRELRGRTALIARPLISIRCGLSAVLLSISSAERWSPTAPGAKIIRTPQSCFGARLLLPQPSAAMRKSEAPGSLTLVICSGASPTLVIVTVLSLARPPTSRSPNSNWDGVTLARAAAGLTPNPLSVTFTR